MDMTANVIPIIITSGRPIRISRAATLTLATGTSAIAERNEIPGITDASEGTKLMRYTGKKYICASLYVFSLVPSLASVRSEEHTSELQSRLHLACRLL